MVQDENKNLNRAWIKVFGVDETTRAWNRKKQGRRHPAIYTLNLIVQRRAYRMTPGGPCHQSLWSMTRLDQVLVFTLGASVVELIRSIMNQPILHTPPALHSDQNHQRSTPIDAIAALYLRPQRSKSMFCCSHHAKGQEGTPRRRKIAERILLLLQDTSGLKCGRTLFLLRKGCRAYQTT